jgi:hypothetical protein
MCTVVLSVLIAVSAGCGADGNASQTPGASVAESEKSNALINTGEFTCVYDYALEDTDAEWDKATATAVVFDDDAAQISGSGASFADATLIIGQAGTYVLSGTLTGGQVLVDAGENDIVRLVLSGVSLHNEEGPAIYAPTADKTVLILERGTENTVSDGAGYGNNADEPDAAIFAQDDLSVTGEGRLVVNSAGKHGIRSQDVLAISAGVFDISTAGDALRGRDGVAIQGGDFTLNAGGDGIQSNNDEDGAKGFVIINGGEYIIRAGSDGIQAQSALTVTDGNIQITTGGGSANAADAGAAEEESASMKALKAGKLMYIAGGDIVIDAEDDAVHSNGDLIMTAGKLSAQTGDDGFHADAALEILGGVINIPVCYEGIEGLSVTIGGGDTVIAASDDAVNAAGGADSASDRSGPMGRDRFSSNGDIFVRITGGTLDLLASRDGIDSNGDIFFEGGAVKISGPSQGMEGAIDLDGAMLVSGGELITAGSVMNISQESTQAVILVSYGARQASGSVIEIKDAAGEILLEYTSKTDYTMSGFTSPLFKIGEMYSLFIGGEKKTDIKLESLITSTADDGSAYNGGRGFGRGNPGGEMPFGEDNRSNGDNRPERTPPDGLTPPEEGMPADGWSPPDGSMPPDGDNPAGRGRPAGGEAPPEGWTPPEGGMPPEEWTSPEGGMPPEGRTPPEGRVPSERETSP